MSFPAPFFLGCFVRIDRPPTTGSHQAPIDRESPLWQAAEGMEAQFLKEMLRNMRKTVQESPEMENSQGYKVFRGMLDDHYAETAARTQGIGLAEIIVKQVLEMQNAPAPTPRPLARAPEPNPAEAPAAGSSPISTAEGLNKSDGIGK